MSASRRSASPENSRDRRRLSGYPPKRRRTVPVRRGERGSPSFPGREPPSGGIFTKVHKLSEQLAEHDECCLRSRSRRQPWLSFSDNRGCHRTATAVFMTERPKKGKEKMATTAAIGGEEDD
nr:hypothetical protein Iba_chr13dCG4480 [Ipomoea batatas]